VGFRSWWKACASAASASRACSRTRTSRSPPRASRQSRDRRIKVLIAGAGIGGLTAALAALRGGCDVEVYEQAPELKEVGAGLQLSANGTRALYQLGVGEELKALSCEATGKEIRLWNTGETWKLFDLGSVSVERYGFPYLTVYRPDLLDVLARAVRRHKPDAIHLGSKALGFVQHADRVELRLDDGASDAGDTLIGADGVHSMVRQVLFGADRPQFTGIIAWRGIIPMERLPAHMARMVGVNWVGPGGHVVHYPLRAGKVMNFVGALERADWRVESWSARGTIEELAADFAGWHGEVQALISNIPVPYKWALMVRAPMPRWSAGRVTLLGDACHSMVPFLAQGAVMAIEDGYMLARALALPDLQIPEKLLRYENARRDRTRGAVEGSADNITRFHNRALADPAKAREYVEREWAGASIASRYEWLFTYDVATAPL
jgi:salicylate hydroxylase